MEKIRLVCMAICLFSISVFGSIGCQEGLTEDNSFNGEEETTSVSMEKASYTLTLHASQDGRAFSIYPDHAAGNASYFGAESGQWSRSAGWVRGYIQFDLSSIPANSTITNATLYLYHHPEIWNYVPYPIGNASYLERVTKSWNANTLTWNNQPSVTDVNKVYLAKSAVLTQDYVLNVTNMMGDMLVNKNYGMRLKMAAEDSCASMYFASSDYSNSAYRPKLVITYVPHVSVSLSVANKAIATAYAVNGSGNYQYTWTIDCPASGPNHPYAHTDTIITSTNTLDVAYYTYVCYSAGGTYTVSVSVKDLTDGYTAFARTTVYHPGN